MAKSKTVLEAELRARYVDLFTKFLESIEEEPMLVKSNTIAFPTVDEELNDKFITVTVTVKQGARDDNDGYDGYTAATMYAEHIAEKAEKAKKAEEEKQRKIARDKAQREARARAKAEHEAKKNEGEGK